MHIHLIAIGRAKSSSPTEALLGEYAKRLPWSFTVKELEEKKPLPSEQRREREADLLLGACANADRIVALDERGKEFSSQQFADQLGKWQMDGAGQIHFLIGGQDGLSERVRKAAHLTLSFGRMTWPHMLVRPLLAEQIYRAYTILASHPYHREG